MAKLFGITADQASRIGRVLDDSEHRGPQPKNLNSGKRPATEKFWAILTGEDPANAGRYKFEKQHPEAYELVESDPAFVVTAYTAVEANEQTGLVGDRVELHFEGYDTSDPPKAIYRFHATAKLPAGQYQGMGLRTVAQLQSGFEFDTDTAII